jgi:hypothetical protein
MVHHSLKSLLPFGVRLTLAQGADEIGCQHVDEHRDGDPDGLTGDVVGALLGR